MAIVSVSEAKQHLNITTSTNDGELQMFCEAATAVIERHIGKVVEQRTFVEDVPLRGASRVFLSHGPVVSITSVATTDGLVSWNPATLTIDNGLGTLSTALARFGGTVRFTYVAGMEPVPAHIRLAALVIVGHLWETQRPTVAAAPGIGGFDDAAAGPSAGLAYAIPNRALELLGGAPPVFA